MLLSTLQLSDLNHQDDIVILVARSQGTLRSDASVVAELAQPRADTLWEFMVLAYPRRNDPEPFRRNGGLAGQVGLRSPRHC
jgi:hypothetical protein